jgi:hypothetical protein
MFQAICCCEVSPIMAVSQSLSVAQTQPPSSVWVGCVALQDNLPLSYEFHPHQNQYVLFVVQLQVPPEPPAWSQHRQQGGNHPQDLNAGRSSESGGQGDSRQPTTTGSVHAQQGQEQGDNEGGAAVAKKAGKKQWQQPPPQYQYRWGYAPSAWFYKMLADEPKQFAFEGGVASVSKKVVRLSSACCMVGGSSCGQLTVACAAVGM